MYGHAHEKIRSLHATLFLSLRCNGKYLAFGRAVATSPIVPTRLLQQTCLPTEPTL